MLRASSKFNSNTKNKEVYVFGRLPSNIKPTKEAFIGWYNNNFDVVYIVDSSMIDFNKVKEIIIDVGNTTVKGFIYI